MNHRKEENKIENERSHRHLGTLIAILAALIVSFTVRAFAVETFVVPSGSMLETIQEGDVFFGEKITYRTNPPQPGDIVTFADPESPNRTLVKRVIATEGQVIDIRDGNLYIDGVMQQEDYTLGKPTEDLYSGVTYPHTVADGCLWVMGDNRTNSADSRYFGDIPVESVSSKATIVFWPLDRFGESLN